MAMYILKTMFYAPDDPHGEELPPLTKAIMPQTGRIAVLLSALIFFSFSVSAQSYRLSDGLYRIPYADNTKVSVNSDVDNHDPPGCFDMHGVQGIGVYQIVAAADGWIRAIRDNFNRNCHSSLAPPNDWCCGEFNNFIILEHPNGEWSSYIHLAQNSITNLGHVVGAWVTAGTVLGFEGNVGCSTGPHLHLEISRPDDPDDESPWDAFDGVLRRDGELLNPVFCSTASGTISSGNTYTAGACAYNCTTNLTVTTAPANDVRRADEVITSTATFSSTGIGMYRAGEAVELKPGFRATEGSMVNMQIKNCNEQN